MSGDFDQHVMRRETGWTWLCRRRSTWIYGFRITWAPGSLVISGDIGDLVVNHYSFDDPWSAAAWVNGACWDYFMEKAAASKEYDPEATAEHIVETAYRQIRDGWSGGVALMERIVDQFGDSLEGDHETAAGRKYACRELLSSGVSEQDAYAITHDAEDLIYRYPESHRRCYAAARWWAQRMWETEPVWHMAVRHVRHARSVVRSLRNYPIVVAPVRYARYDDAGRAIHFNGAQYWRWRRVGDHARYEGLMPIVVFGRDLSRYGFWRLQGSRWPDDGMVDKWGRATPESQFVDVRVRA